LLDYERAVHSSGQEARKFGDEKLQAELAHGGYTNILLSLFLFFLRETKPLFLPHTFTDIPIYRICIETL